MNDSEHIYFSASKAIEYIHLRLSENRLPPFENQVKAFEKTDHLIEHMRHPANGCAVCRWNQVSCPPEALFQPHADDTIATKT